MARGLSLVTACVLVLSCANAENIIGGGAGDGGSGEQDAAVGGGAGATGGSAGVSSGGAPSGGAAGSSSGGTSSGGASGGSGGAVGGSGGAPGGSGGTSAAGGTGATGGTGGTSASGGTGGGGGTGGTVGNPPPAPSVQGCTTCDCCDPWIVSWTPSTGATYYNVFWTCFIIEHTINVGTITSADLCDPLVGMCSSAECANGVASVYVQACNAGACSAKVPVVNGLPIACGGGCCC